MILFYKKSMEKKVFVDLALQKVDREYATPVSTLDWGIVESHEHAASSATEGNPRSQWDFIPATWVNGGQRSVCRVVGLDWVRANLCQ